MSRIVLILVLLIYGYLSVFIPPVYAMHISEGLLPFNWAGLWFLVAIPFLIKGISDIRKKSKIIPGIKPLLGMSGALIFIISCMPVPVPTAGTCSHPAGVGISAILIGPVMSIFVASIALFIQALFLAHGGLTTLGANVVSMGIAGSFAAYYTFKILRRFKAPLFISAFAAGLLADWVTYITTSFELASGLHGNKPVFSLFCTILAAFIPTQLPLGILEGFLTGGMIVFVHKRRPDILVSLGVVRETGKCIIKSGAKIIVVLLIMFLLSANNCFLFAGENTKWEGVDKTVVEKVAQEQGRAAWTPFINTDQGDLLLFVFLLAGVAGGFVLGYNFRKIFVEKGGIKDV